MLPSHRNQSIDLLCRSIDWFLYEGNTGILWVNRSIDWFLYEGNTGILWVKVFNFPAIGTEHLR